MARHESASVHGGVLFPGILFSLLVALGCTGGEQTPRPAAPPRAQAPTPQLPQPPPPPLTVDAIGTAHPFLVRAASPDGRWVVLSQARADTNGDGRVEVGRSIALWGDRLSLYLVRGSGPGELIDDLVATERSGRYLAVVRERRLVLLDTIAGTEVDLTSRGGLVDRDPCDSEREFPPAAFDASAARLFYVREQQGIRRAVVRDLRTGSEREMDTGSGVLWHAKLDPDGGWVIQEVITKDLDGNGVLEPPKRQCKSSGDTFSMASFGGDAVTVRLASTADGHAREVPDLVRPFGARLLRRLPRGALAIEDEKGTTKELVPASCGARLLEADAAAEVVVVACAAGKESAPMAVYGASGARPLPEIIDVPRKDEWSPHPDGFTLSSVHSGLALIDLARAAVYRLGQNGSLLAVHDRKWALVERDGELLVLDAASGKMRPLSVRVNRYAGVFQAGPLVALEADRGLESVVVDLAAGAVAGKLTGRPLAVAPGPSVLVPAGDEDSRVKTNVPDGPAHWRSLSGSPGAAPARRPGGP